MKHTTGMIPLATGYIRHQTQGEGGERKKEERKPLKSGRDGIFCIIAGTVAGILFLKLMVYAVKIPVTVKTRLGWDANNKIIVELAEQLQDCGIAALTIHGRTRAQMYTGEADWTLIGEVKNNPRMHIPIIGNGDVTTPQRCKECFDRYGVDAVMIGRASFGRPWIFKEMKHYLETGEELPPLSFEWCMEVLRQEVIDSVNLLDERKGILHVRRHLAASPLFKGIPNFRDTRIAMLRAETKEELFQIFNEILTNRESSPKN